MSQLNFPEGPLPATVTPIPSAPVYQPSPQVGQHELSPAYGVDESGPRKKGPRQRKVNQAEPAPVGEKKKLITVVGKKARQDEVAETLEDLAAMLEAGQGEEAALSEIGRQYAKFNIGAAYTRAAVRMRDQGASFIDAICAEEDAIPKVARELIRASNTARDLHANLRNAALIVVEATDIKAMIRSSLFKPILLMVMVLAFLVVAGEFLLPQVGALFGNIGADTPEITIVMITVGSSVKWVVLGLVGLVAAWFIYWFAFGRRVPKLRMKMDAFSIRVPLLGPINQMSTAARFSDVLAACIASAMTELESLEIAARACGNEAVLRHVMAHIEKQRNGEATFAQVADSPLFPWNLKNRIELAPSPRHLVAILRDVAQVFHKKSRRRLNAFAERIGPLSEIVVLGAAAVVILMVAIPVTTFIPTMTEMVNL
ncbi:type II secretion system F family protein [Agromyces sp. NPDC057679]|uniref:type II secretion system F family protein n=1 Tax=Agromyces sp. NPDC057679 TaxID=3346207 RepID=UPI00366DB74A